MSDRLPVTGVTGGAGDVRVVVDDVQRLALLCRRVDAELHELAVAAAATQALLAVRLGAPLSPITALAAEAGLQAVLVGPRSVPALGASARALGLALAAAAAAYDATELANTVRLDLEAATTVVRELASVGAAPDLVLPALAGAWADETAEEGRLLGPREAGEAWAADHAADVEVRVAGVATVLGPVMAAVALARHEQLVGPDARLAPVSLAAHQAGDLWADGEPVLTDGGVVAGGRAPRRLADLVDDLADSNDAPAGTITLREVRDEAGGPPRALVVDVPGTDTWELPGEQTGSARDLGGNVSLSGGQATAYVRGIEAAVVASGVSRSTPVALVGHSQGGMASVVAARRLRERGYRVDYVVTAGAPIANLRQPAGVTTLALEDDRDLVPRADGRPNADHARRVTVRVDSGGDRLADNHSLRTYGRAARSADALAEQGDASVGEVVERMRHDGVLDADDAPEQVTQRRVRVTVRRSPPAGEPVGGDPLG